VFRDGQNVTGHEPVGIATEAVDLDSVSATQVAHVPVAVQQLELAMTRGNVRESQDNVATGLSPDHQAGFLQRNGVAPTTRIQLAEHLAVFQRIFRLFGREMARV